MKHDFCCTWVFCSSCSAAQWSLLFLTVILLTLWLLYLIPTTFSAFKHLIFWSNCAEMMKTINEWYYSWEDKQMSSLNLRWPSFLANANISSLKACNWNKKNQVQKFFRTCIHTHTHLYELWFCYTFRLTLCTWSLKQWSQALEILHNQAPKTGTIILSNLSSWFLRRQLKQKPHMWVMGVLQWLFKASQTHNMNNLPFQE